MTLNLLLTSGFPGQHFQNYAKKLVHTLNTFANNTISVGRRVQAITLHYLGQGKQN